MPSEERKCESCDKDSHCSEDHKSRNYMDCAHYRQKQPTEGQRVCPKCGGKMMITMLEDEETFYYVCECGHEEKVR